VATRYHKIAHDPAAIEGCFVTLFLEAYKTAPRRSILDLRCHGRSAARASGRAFFHATTTATAICRYTSLRRHLLAAKLRPANIDASAGSVEEVARIVAQIRARWPHTRIILRADSGFARDALMSWCEANGVDFIFGLAKNVRLARRSGPNWRARDESQASGNRRARFKELIWSTRQELEPQAAGHRQGGGDERRGQSTVSSSPR